MLDPADNPAKQVKGYKRHLLTDTLGRILSRAYERTSESSERDIYLASMRLLLRR
jgi:hypothetical protein